jgi:hypothetical protein
MAITFAADAAPQHALGDSVLFLGVGVVSQPQRNSHAPPKAMIAPMTTAEAGLSENAAG